MQPYIPLFVPPEPIRIFTYNLLYPQKTGEHADERSNPIGYYYHFKSGRIETNYPQRVQAACDYLSKCEADILCLQEVTQQTFETMSMSKQFSHFNGNFVVHPDSSHGVAIFFLKYKFTLLGTFQGVSRSRSHLIVDLRAHNKKIMRVASCHLRDPRDFDGPEKSAQISAILDAMKPKSQIYRIAASVIAGDFNQDQWGDKPKTGKNLKKPQNPDVAHATMFYPLHILGYQTDGDYTPSEFKRKALDTGKRDKSDPQFYQQPIVLRKRKIDYIWIRTQNNTPPHVIFSGKPADAASDHAPVGSMFNL